MTSSQVGKPLDKSSRTQKSVEHVQKFLDLEAKASERSSPETDHDGLEGSLCDFIDDQDAEHTWDWRH